MLPVQSAFEVYVMAEEWIPQIIIKETTGIIFLYFRLGSSFFCKNWITCRIQFFMTMRTCLNPLLNHLAANRAWNHSFRSILYLFFCQPFTTILTLFSYCQNFFAAIWAFLCFFFHNKTYLKLSSFHPNLLLERFPQQLWPKPMMLLYCLFALQFPNQLIP